MSEQDRGSVARSPAGSLASPSLDAGSATPSGAPLTVDQMSKNERSCLLYLETCAVDAGGIVEAIRMNAADHEAVAMFRDIGLLEFWRIPASLLGDRYRETWTHIVRLTAAGFALAGDARACRARHHGPFAARCIAELERQGRFRPLTEDGSQSPPASDGEASKREARGRPNQNNQESPQ